MSKTCRQQAMRWVHRYALGGAAFAALPLPIPTTGALTALELHMLNAIGRIYGEPSSSMVNVVAAGGLRAMGTGLKFVVKRVSKMAPIMLRPVIHGATAALVIESIGRGVIEYFEDKYPGREFSPA